MTMTHAISAGRAAPLGACFDGEGVNFAVFSAHATRMVLCLFSEDGKTEVQRLDLPERDGDVWHGHISGLRPGQLYGYRAHGPYAPQEGHRFNPNKRVIDPVHAQVLHARAERRQPQRQPAAAQPDRLDGTAVWQGLGLWNGRGHGPDTGAAIPLGQAGIAMRLRARPRSAGRHRARNRRGLA